MIDHDYVMKPPKVQGSKTLCQGDMQIQGERRPEEDMEALCPPHVPCPMHLSHLAVPGYILL